jgi:biopolymer transport protein ExbD
MFQSVQQQRTTNDATAAVDIAPLIDIVFILLIFFLVTTTFVGERGIEVTRPAAAHAGVLHPEALRVHITAADRVFVNGAPAEADEIAAQVRAFLARQPGGSVIVVPDERVSSKRLVDIVDAAKAGGATDIGLATRRKATP